jgi:sigma-B regulation protein RsbU (phosphoserine phosphatase)
MNPASARVLVVDDVADNRDILVRRLGRLGISLVEQATNGREALEALRWLLEAAEPLAARRIAAAG